MIDVSLCSLAMLALVVDATEGASSDDLLKGVPPHVRRDQLPGELDDWPHDVCEWFDELQKLLDAGFVKRDERERRYVYVATDRGLVVLRAALHPRGDTMGSLA